MNKCEIKMKNLLSQLCNNGNYRPGVSFSPGFRFQVKFGEDLASFKKAV